MQDISLRNIVIYLSIAFFTVATETYYMKDYSRKSDHVKAIKIALTAFDLNCTYVLFLIKILNDHFGTQMMEIV